jgi:hypothetical protein
MACRLPVARWPLVVLERISPHAGFLCADLPSNPVRSRRLKQDICFLKKVELAALEHQQSSRCSRPSSSLDLVRFCNTNTPGPAPAEPWTLRLLAFTDQASQARAQAGRSVDSGWHSSVLGLPAPPCPCREGRCRFSQHGLHAMHTSSARPLASFDQPCDKCQRGSDRHRGPANIKSRPTAELAPSTFIPRLLSYPDILPVS